MKAKPKLEQSMQEDPFGPQYALARVGGRRCKHGTRYYDVICDYS